MPAKTKTFSQLWQEAESQIEIEQNILFTNQYILHRKIKLGHKFGRGHKQTRVRQEMIFEYTSLQSKSYRRKLRQQRGPLCECCHNDPSFTFYHIDENKRNDKPTNLLLLCRHCHANLRLRRICILAIHSRERQTL